MPDPTPPDATLADPLPVAPLTAPLDAVVAVPGSKSITNRALPVAALAAGTSLLHGVGEGDDVEAMLDALRALGVAITLDEARTATVAGTAGVLPAGTVDGPVTIDVRQSGTTARFLTAILAFGDAPVRIEADAQMQSRPMGLLVDVLRDLGAAVVSDGEDGTLPFLLTPATRRAGTALSMPGSITSQFSSGLLLSAPLHGGAHAPRGLHLTLEAPVVSRPYLDMTAAVMAAFGVPVERSAASFVVRAGAAYRAADYRIEPDASAASYFFGAAAITRGRVRVPGLGESSLQGDLGFVRLLERMGATVVVDGDGTTVSGTGELSGIDVDMADLSDTVPTLAVVAAFAGSPTRIRGVGFIRHKESDRIGNVVRELRRAGVHAEEHDDGMTVDPTRGAPRGARIDTYDDHRMAMAFSLLGLRAPGIEIADPACVNKTYPGYWRDLAGLASAPQAT
jgi:3-phosphoshikimate 1-carboxyvinyltransferase